MFVAVLGLWIAHWLTLRRERRKEAGTLCDELTELAEGAVSAALVGWDAAAGPDRVGATYKAKWEAQKVGLAATRLHRQTSGPMSTGIDVTKHAAIFRTALFDDPTDEFLDANRAANGSKSPALHGALAGFVGKVNELRNIVLR
ncbi:MAG: hypothetical protein ABWX67_01525 [Allosphingosinicella sp.]